MIISVSVLSANGVASSPGSLCISHWRAFSRNLTYLIACGQGPLERWLHFSSDIVSALSLWHKWTPKSSYKKCRFAAFLCCLRTAAVFANTKIHPSTLRVTHVRKSTSPTATLKWNRARGPGNEATNGVYIILHYQLPTMFVYRLSAVSW